MPFSVLRRIRHGEPVVIVSGLPRSGTSMVMKMLEAGGMDLAVDGVRGADEDNPKGYFEHEHIKTLEDESEGAWLRGVRGRAVKVVSLLLKYLPRDNNYQVIFLQRDLGEVLASQRKMLERRGERSESDDARMAELYSDHLWRTRYLLDHDARFEWLEVAYREIVEAPHEQAVRIASFLARPLDAKGMAAAVDPTLYRNRAGAATTRPDASANG
jgi:hypothetical protein